VKLKKTFLLAAILWGYHAYAQTKCPVIPMPASATTVDDATVAIGKKLQTRLGAKAGTNAAGYLKTEVAKITTLPDAGKKAPAVILSIAKLENTNPEYYELQVTDKAINITANTDKGLFNGVVTLLQLIRNEAGQLHHWTIKDAPQYGWRGFMLDESRHFFGKQKVKSLLDWMAYYKLNKFHWHLTDEPGWRIEIKQYPKLTSIGGIGNYTDPKAPATFYTQADVKEIVRYAAERNIDVIPEIDMPGHATAANNAYPEYSGGGSKGHPEFTFNPGKEATYSYLTNILREINQLFPAHMIHLGGDEVSYGNEKWSSNKDIQALMQREHLANLKEVELYFMQRMSDSLYKLNSKMLAWDEMAEVSLPKDKTIIYWWRHDKPNTLKMALEKGYTTVICPRLPLYFDFVQDSAHKHGRKWSKLYNPVESVYRFSPLTLLPADVSPSLVAGMQANLWTETVSDTKRLDYLLFPRICALAEICWTAPEKKNEADFMQRLQPQLKLFEAAGLYYYDPFQPNLHPEPVPKKKTISDYKD